MHLGTAAGGGQDAICNALRLSVTSGWWLCSRQFLALFLPGDWVYAVPFTDQNLIWWSLTQLSNRGSGHQHWSAYSVPDLPQWHSNCSTGVAQWFFTCDKRFTRKVFSNGPQSAKDDTGKAGWWAMRWESWRASGFKNKSVCTPAQKCPAKPNTLVCCIIPEPSGWVKSVIANKVAIFPRFQLSQALFCVRCH